MTQHELTAERMDEIRETAYRIWESEGCPDGCALEHWLRAKREVEAPSTDPSALTDAIGEARARKLSAKAAARALAES